MGIAALPLIGLGLTAGSTAAGVVSNVKRAGSQRRQFQQQFFFARERAADALARGGNLAARALGEADRLKGAQRASVAGRGFEVGVGTAGQITEATDLIGSIDALTIRENARREAKGHLIDAFSAQEGERATSATGANVGTLIGGASAFSGQLANILAV